MNALFVGFGEKNALVLLFHTVLVCGRGRTAGFWLLLMTCKWLASDWLAAVSVTVIKPIQPTERRHREGEREREDTERERGQRERETHWAPWGFLVD